eukprot:m.97338 g.97338  ORF g.97338 m.97338 type:complete len:114 (+) comp15058_c0_seq55:1715-2056(+)
MQLLTTYDSNSPVVGKALVSQGITRDQAGMLTITPGRSVDIVCMDRPSPKGFWICRNAEGEVGFVSTQYVQLDPSSVRDLLEAIPKPARVSAVIVSAATVRFPECYERVESPV